MLNIETKKKTVCTIK